MYEEECLNASELWNHKNNAQKCENVWKLSAKYEEILRQCFKAKIHVVQKQDK